MFWPNAYRNAYLKTHGLKDVGSEQVILTLLFPDHFLSFLLSVTQRKFQLLGSEGARSCLLLHMRKGRLDVSSLLA